MDFGEAIRALRDGQRVARDGWNGKGMWLELQVPDEHSKMSLPYIYMFTACQNRVPWLASQSDMLAVDWVLIETAAPKRKAAKKKPKLAPSGAKA